MKKELSCRSFLRISALSGALAGISGIGWSRSKTDIEELIEKSVKMFRVPVNR